MKKYCACIVVLFICLSQNIKAQKNLSQNTTPGRPAVVIGLVVDQMRWDYLYRYYDRFGTGGFRRLMAEGFNFESAQIPYVPTVTAAGHTCIYSGTVPAVHGIVGNDWIENKTGEIMYCTRDLSVKGVGGNTIQGQMSPKNLLVTTFPDELRLSNNFRSRTFAIAMKDRGGILAAGHTANAAYWFEDASGKWISSTYYMNALPAWVDTFNAAERPAADMKKDWNLLYPLGSYQQSTTDSQHYEKFVPYASGPTFPHRFAANQKDYYAFRVSPYGNTYTLDFAAALLEAEELGKKGYTDVLCVSLSSTDYLAHRFGPNSIEMEDTYLRLDKDIETFLDMLDARVGKGKYTLFLTADHGAASVPGFAQQQKLPGGNLKMLNVKKELNHMLAEKFGSDSLVPKIFDYQVYVNQGLLQKKNISEAAVSKEIIRYFNNRPEVQMVFDYADMGNVLLPAAVKEKFINGYYSPRSGNIQVILKSGYDDVDLAGTEHGSWYNYDSHIPLVFFGWGVKPGQSFRKVSMADIAPTISALLRVQMPSGSIGKVLGEIVH